VVVPPRQSERLHLQQEPAAPKGRITRSQAKKHESEQISSLAIEEFSDNAKKSLERNLTSMSDDSDSCEVAISATPVTDENSCALVRDKNQDKPASVEETLDSPIWRKSMDKEYKALIDHST
jgi:hypothetical protein